MTLSLLAFSLTTFAQTSRDIVLTDAQLVNSLRVVDVAIKVEGRRSEVRATVTFPNPCVATGNRKVVFSRIMTGEKMAVSLIALPDNAGPRLCTREFRPVNITYVLPINIFGADDRPVAIEVNGVPARF